MCVYVSLFAYGQLGRVRVLLRQEILFYYSYKVCTSIKICTFFDFTNFSNFNLIFHCFNSSPMPVNKTAYVLPVQNFSLIIALFKTLGLKPSGFERAIIRQKFLPEARNMLFGISM